MQNLTATDDAFPKAFLPAVEILWLQRHSTKQAGTISLRKL